MTCRKCRPPEMPAVRCRLSIAMGKYKGRLTAECLPYIRFLLALGSYDEAHGSLHFAPKAARAPRLARLRWAGLFYGLSTGEFDPLPLFPSHSLGPGVCPAVCALGTHHLLFLEELRRWGRKRSPGSKGACFDTTPMQRIWNTGCRGPSPCPASARERGALLS